MTQRIESLTPQQVERMAEFRDKWVKIGLSTAPACRETAEEAIQQAYTAAGLPPPAKIVWCGSPLSQGLTRAIVLATNEKASVGASVWDSVRDSVWDSVRDSVWDSVWDSVRASVRASVGDSVRASVRASVRDSVGDSVWDSVRDSVGDSVRASVGDSVWDSVRDSVRDSVWDSVRDSVWDSVWDSVRASVRASVGDSVRASVRDSVGDSGYGQHDAAWLSFYDYFREACGLTAQTDPLAGLTSLAQNAGWFLPHQNICWVSERHHMLMRDARGRLHCETGPAIMYPDGWAIYAWHGVRVPKPVIENRETITAKQILDEKNTEIRRVMRNLYGTGRFLADVGATSISEAPAHRAKLLSFRLEGDPEDIRMLELTCPSTGEVYYERVRPEMTDCMEALASRIKIQPAQYTPTWET